jgi:protoporphyrinogen/coproporphyrinogen III oxidase
MAKIAVIGGGAAGLNAARKLNDLGQQVVLFEKSHAIGGRARSETLEGCVVDVGAQLFGSGFRALFEFADAVHARTLLVRSPGRDAVWRNGRVHPITYGNVASMVTSSALPATLKLKLGARYVPFLLRQGQLDPGDPCAHGGDRLEGESVAEWGRRELGTDFVELLAYPLLGAYYGSTPEDTTVVLYHALARAGLDVSVYAVDGGTSRLFETAADYLERRGVSFRRGAEAGKVVSSDGKVTLDGETFDGAVLAVPPSVATKICAFPEQLQTWMSGVRFAGSAVLALVLKDRIGADYFGVSIPRADAASDIVALCVQQNKLPGLVPTDRSLLVALGAPAANAELLADPRAGVERMINAIDVVMPGVRNRVLHAKLYRHTEGYPVFYDGYLQHLRSFPPYAIPRVMLAGDYLVSPTVEGALRSGERAALRLFDQVRGN